MSDTFYKVPRLRRLLQPRDTDLKGVPSPQELLLLSQRRPSRKVVEAKRVLELVNGETDPAFDYRAERSHFLRLAEGMRMKSGQGAEYFDAEATLTVAS